jgi:D-glycero-alpha-D-manno-heptose-7-phosphate kinase
MLKFKNKLAIAPILLAMAISGCAQNEPVTPTATVTATPSPSSVSDADTDAALISDLFYQDQIAASYGGFNLITFSKDNTFRVSNISKNISYINKLNENLILVYTGIVRTANDIAKTYVDKLSSSNNKIKMRSILQNVKDAKILIENRRLDDLGRLLHESWIKKKDLSSQVTNDKIDFIYNLGLKHGALGGKLLGAGGGGFFLFYVPLEKRNFFLKK